MVKIPDEFIEALSELGNAMPYQRRTTTAWGNHLPGDILLFNYDKVDRICLVVSSKRGPLGKFISTRNNPLINCFILNLSLPSSVVLFKILFKNRVACRYKTVPKLLFHAIGENKFKTFNLNKINNLTELYLNVQ